MFLNPIKYNKKYFFIYVIPIKVSLLHHFQMEVTLSSRKTKKKKEEKQNKTKITIPCSCVYKNYLICEFTSFFENLQVKQNNKKYKNRMENFFARRIKKVLLNPRSICIQKR